MIRLKAGNTIHQGLPGQAASVTFEIPNLEFTEIIRAPRPTDESLGLDRTNIDGTKLWPQYAETAIHLGEMAAKDFYRYGERTDLVKQAQLHAAVAQELRERDI